MTQAFRARLGGDMVYVQYIGCHACANAGGRDGNGCTHAKLFRVATLRRGYI